jgi:hypothetical protein
MEKFGPYCCMDDRFFALYIVHIVCKYKGNLSVTVRRLFCSFFKFKKNNRKTICATAATTADPGKSNAQGAGIPAGSPLCVVWASFILLCWRARREAVVYTL